MKKSQAPPHPELVGDPEEDTTEWEMVGPDGRALNDAMTFMASTEDEARDMARRTGNLPSEPVRFVRKTQRERDGLAEGAMGAALGALILGPIGLVVGGALGAMLGRGSAAPADALGTLEGAFLGSDFFPIRIGDRIDATRDGVVLATVRVRDGAIVVEQVGHGKRAEANAKRLAQLFVSRGGRPRPPPSSSGSGGATGDDAVTYAVMDNGKVLARGAPAEEVVAAMRRAKPRGDATVIDERDGTVVIAGTDGDETTLAMVETLLEDHESKHVVAAHAQPFEPTGATGTYRCWVVTKKCERSRLMSVRCPRSVTGTGRRPLMLDCPCSGGTRRSREARGALTGGGEVTRRRRVPPHERAARGGRFARPRRNRRADRAVR